MEKISHVLCMEVPITLISPFDVIEVAVPMCLWILHVWNIKR